jgi:Tol biopolymer transport system component
VDHPRQRRHATRITSWDMEPTAPVWSPDGSLVAFQNYDAEGNYHIWVVRPNGADLRRVTTGPYDDREPAWTPDGKGLVFASDRSNDGQYKIWRVSLAEPNYVAHLGPRRGKQPGRVARRQAAGLRGHGCASSPRPGGSDAPKLVAPGTMPAWAPDGTGLVFQNDRKALTVARQGRGAGRRLLSVPGALLPDGRFMYTADGKIKIRSGAGRRPATCRSAPR